MSETEKLVRGYLEEWLKELGFNVADLGGTEVGNMGFRFLISDLEILIFGREAFRRYFEHCLLKHLVPLMTGQGDLTCQVERVDAASDPTQFIHLVTGKVLFRRGPLPTLNWDDQRPPETWRDRPPLL